MSPPPTPCCLCGYDAPTEPCPHCGGAPLERSLSARPAGPLLGVAAGLVALPRGLLWLLTTRGVKRWMVPPLLLTSGLLAGILVWLARVVDRAIDRVAGSGVDLSGARAWTEHLPGWLGWVDGLWRATLAVTEWMLHSGWVLFREFRWLGWFLLGSLVAWYVFSVVYEALAGPFLDEIHGRFETRWFGLDPRDRLQRPTDLPASRCALLSGIWIALAVLVALLLGGRLSYGVALVAPLAALAPIALVERRYLTWLLWVARIEGAATFASLEASVLVGLGILLALPLYFVPVVGYFLFAAVAGFATSIGLLDIPFERRGWPLSMRLRFVLRNVLPFGTFGTVAGLLLSVPVLGPLLMVPSASIGGLWLLCRLDKGFLRTSPGSSPTGVAPRRMRRPPSDPDPTR